MEWSDFPVASSSTCTSFSSETCEVKIPNILSISSIVAN
jgi:hypothetical protein